MHCFFLIIYFLFFFLFLCFLFSAGETPCPVGSLFLINHRGVLLFLRSSLTHSNKRMKVKKRRAVLLVVWLGKPQMPVEEEEMFIVHFRSRTHSESLARPGLSSTFLKLFLFFFFSLPLAQLLISLCSKIPIPV